MPVYKNESNNSWYIKTYVKDEYGNSKQITKRNKEWVGRKGKEEAQQEEVRLKNEHKRCKDNLGNITIEEASKKYLEEQEKYNKESSFYDRTSTIKNHILPFFSSKLVEDITVDDIKQWHEKLNEKGYSIAYKNKCHGVLNGIFKACGININPAYIVGRFKKSQQEKEKVVYMSEKLRYITHNDFEKFISIIDNPLWYVYFNLLYFTGMRKGEIQALAWEDIDFKNKQIHVTKTLTTKTNKATWKITSTKNLKNRIIDVDDNLLKILKDYFQLKSQEINFSLQYFVLGNTEPLKSHKIEHNKEKYFKMSGIEEITNHEFRHSHVSLMVNEYLKTGQTDTTKFFIMMSHRLGHTIEVMQKTYLHLFPDIQTPIVSLIEKLN